MKKVEIHVFPDKTSGSKSYRVSFLAFVASIACVVLSVVGFIIFSPDRIVDNLSNGNALAVFRQNKTIKKEIKVIRESVDESILKAEETKILRDSTVYRGGLGFILEENAIDEVLAGPRKSLNEVEATFRRLEVRLLQDSALAANIPVIHPLKNEHVVKNRFEMIYDPFTEQELPHRGIDYVAAIGDTVYATGGGVVTEVRSHRGFGLSILCSFGQVPGEGRRKGSPRAADRHRGRKRSRIERRLALRNPRGWRPRQSRGLFHNKVTFKGRIAGPFVERGFTPLFCV